MLSLFEYNTFEKLHSKYKEHTLEIEKLINLKISDVFDITLQKAKELHKEFHDSNVKEGNSMQVVKRAQEGRQIGRAHV